MIKELYSGRLIYFYLYIKMNHCLHTTNKDEIFLLLWYVEFAISM